MKQLLFLTCLFLLSSCAPWTHEVSRVTLPADEFLIIAHRGASAYAPEHSIAAYELALQMGAPYIELDLQMTKDGQLVALHDRNISLNDRQLDVTTMTYEELMDYRPGIMFNKQHPVYASTSYQSLSLLTLEEILVHFGNDARYYIELKSPQLHSHMEEAFIATLQKYLELDDSTKLPPVIVQSFHAESLLAIQQLDPSLPLIQLYAFDSTAFLSKQELRKLQRYASGIGVNAEAITPSFVDLVQSYGLHLHPYTVNGEQAIKSMYMLGVNGIFTDEPDVAYRVQLQEEGVEGSAEE